MAFRLIDTHNHIDSEIFDADRFQLVETAREKGVEDALICSGIPGTLEKTRLVAHQIGWHYALGVHPLYVESVTDPVSFLASLETLIRESLSDPLFAAVGEIGLDGFVPGLDKTKMLFLFREQLRIARKYALPVSVHARHAVDAVSKELATSGIRRGAVHAFNGSVQQAARLTGLGLKLGFGGALTYTGSLRIRRIFQSLSDTDFVLETDAPDMPGRHRRNASDKRTHPSDIEATLLCASELRKSSPENLAQHAIENSLQAFPKLENFKSQFF